MIARCRLMRPPTATPTPMMWRASTREVAIRVCTSPATRSMIAWKPSSALVGLVLCSMTFASRFARAAWMLVRPMSTPTMKRESAANRTRLGGRPPLDDPAPTLTTSISLRMRLSTIRVTVGAESRARLAMSAREAEPICRISSRTRILFSRFTWVVSMCSGPLRTRQLLCDALVDADRSSRLCAGRLS